MTGFILAAGFGSRMLPYTENVPKPMLPVGGVPLIYYSLFFLFQHNIHSVIINTHYLADQVVAELTTLQGFDFRFSHEKKILGTAGAIRQACRSREELLLINPDIIFWPTGADRPESLSGDFETRLFLAPKSAASGEPGWIFDNGMALKMNRSAGDYYYLGYSVVDSGLVSHLPSGEFFELGPVWEDKAQQGRVSGQVFRGNFISVGTADEYQKIADVDVLPASFQPGWQRFLRFIGRLS